MIPPLDWSPGEGPFAPARPPASRSRPEYPYQFRWPKQAGGRRRTLLRPASPEPEPWAPEPIRPEPVKPEPASPKPRLALSNPRWIEARGEFGSLATAAVDAEAPPTAATRVIFTVWMEWGRGQRRELPAGEGHVPEGGGTVAIRIRLEPPGAGGEAVGACRYSFSAKHSLSERVAGGPLEAGPGREPPFEGVILYAPARGEYLWLPTEAGVRGIQEETGKLRGLRDRAMLAWENPDPSRRAEALRDLGKESEDLFGGKSVSNAKGALEELLLVRRNPHWNGSSAWVYLPSGSDAVAAGSWRKENDPAVRAELDKLLGPQGEKRISPFLKTKFKANLFRRRPKAGDLWHWCNPGSRTAGATSGPASGHAEGQPAESRRFAFTAEAALGRYFAGWDGVEASFDPAQRKLALGTAGSASFALFEGAVSLSLDLPDAGGLNLIGWLAGVKHRGVYLIDPKRACRLKLRLRGSLSAFVGGTLQGALSMTGSFTDSRPAEAGGGVTGFAGAQATAECRGALQWAPSQAGPFADLAILKGSYGASVGFGGEAKLKVGYTQGVFRFEVSAAAGLGLGLKGGAAFEVGARSAMELLGHLYDCVDFHFVEEIAADAFAAYRNYAFAAFIGELERERSMQALGRAEADWARHRVGRFAEWLRERSGDLERIKAEILARSGERSLLRKMPPEALGRVLAILMRTREPSDFQGLRYILGSAVRAGEGPAVRVSQDHKLKWVLRSVSDIPIPAAGAPGREARKKEALEDGIRIIREFGMAEGRWAGQRGQTGDPSFTAWFHRFLSENGI